MKGSTLEKVFFSNTQNPKTVNTFTADDKHYLPNRDNLAQLIQMQLSQKKKNFSHFPFAFLKSIFNYKHLSRKMTLIADAFREIPAPKNMAPLEY